MRIISWNVAGLRACVKKGFFETMKELNPDIVCLQEVKAEPSQVSIDMDGYDVIWNPANKRGYSGTMLISRIPIVDKILEVNKPKTDADYEGRVITVDLGTCYLTTAYVPNSKKGLVRLEERMLWEEHMRNFLVTLDSYKSVIYCGDLNVAHTPIDLKHPDTNHETPGFSDQERECFTNLLNCGFVDTFRALHPDARDVYSFWTYFGNARENNAGWRLDYFLVSERAMPCVRSSEVLMNVRGSDHCPILLDIE